MSVLWTSKDAAQATNGTATTDFEITGISIDTRTVKEGDLFVALKAARDGHDFVAQALEKGASAALVSRIPDGVAPDAPLLLVDDVLPALERLGAAARERMSGQVIGVTGSVGKTSTKEMLRAILQGQGKVHAAEASYNNHWGVPLTLARMPQDTVYAIIEIGMSNPGEIAPLAKLARPHVAMITTVAPAHMAAFESLEGIAHEKAAIFDGLEPAGIAVINADLSVTPILTGAWPGSTLTFGEAKDANAVLEGVKLTADKTFAAANVLGQDLAFELSTAGRHFATNAVGCLAVVAAVRANVAKAAEDLILWLPPEGRGARETIELLDGPLEMFDDAFNANPTSMAASLEVLAAAKPATSKAGQGRRIAILGDMLELGTSERADHAAIAQLSWVKNVDQFYCVGPLMKALFEALPTGKRGAWYAGPQDAMADLPKIARAGDVVLVKGSKGSKVSLLVDGLRQLGHPKRA
jgi:UDP-N-acetylmuramoyl-tripeptide--D-alanyl-D-alanine ligase